MIKHRLIFGSLMIVAVATLNTHDKRLPHPGLIVLGICTVIALWGFAEFCRMMAALGHGPFTRLGALSLVGLFAWNIYALWHGAAVQVPVAWWVLSVGGLFLASAFVYFNRSTIADVAVTTLGLLVVGVPMLMVVQLRLLGVGVLVMVLAATKLNDVAAYLVGSRIGKHKIVPKLSPKKSLEGFIAGLVLSVAVAVGCSTLLSGTSMDVNLTVLQGVILGLVVGVVGPLGDLFVSLVKRQSKVKDSGDIVPTFGGMLDIIDSILLSVPVTLVVIDLLKHV